MGSVNRGMITLLGKAEEAVPHEAAFFSVWDHIIFTIFCAFALLIDPVFLYVNISDDKKYMDLELDGSILGSTIHHRPAFCS